MEQLRLVGEVDIDVVDAIRTRFLREVICWPAAFPGESLKIDCSELEFIDSSGLGMLVEFQRKTAKKLVLIGVPERCRTPFEVTRLDTVFELR